MENISFRQADLILQIPRCQHLLVQDDVFDVGAVIFERIEDGISKGIPLFI